ncbi:MAG: hemolysin family protein [Chloroflexota bacterium]
MMVDILIWIAVIGLSISFNALYVGAEFAIVKARHHRMRIAQMADNGHTLAKQLSPVLQDQKRLDHFVAACQLGITVTSIVLGAFGQNTVAEALSPVLSQSGFLSEALAISISAGIVLFCFTLLQMVIGELVPKSIAVQYPEKVSLATIYPIHWSATLFYPFIKIFNGSGDAILRLLGVDYQDEHGDTHSLDEIERMVTHTHEGGLIDDKEQQMLRNAFRMRELTAKQVMVPRTRMVATPVTATLSETLAKCIEGGFSRIPVYEDTIDTIIGVVHIKDLFRQHLNGEKDSLHDLMREVIYVPDTLPITTVWESLNENRQYLVIVFDEHGGTQGLITFEDVIEEIFGELQDEFDENEMALISYDKDGRTHLRGDLLITDINEYLNLTLPFDEADTLGGLVLTKLGRPPKQGDKIVVANLQIHVESVADTGVIEFSFDTPSSEPVSINEWEVASDE